jgi:hypothetical protein
MPIILIGLAALAAFLILNGHGYHLLSLAPLLIFLACPLMHIFGHHGHGGHAHDETEKPDSIPVERSGV